jgi:hypothetical protein
MMYRDVSDMNIIPFSFCTTLLLGSLLGVSEFTYRMHMS